MSNLVDTTVARTRLENMLGDLDKSILVLQGEQSSRRAGSDSPRDPADPGTTLSDADRTEAVLAAVTLQLREVSEAMVRIDHGVYGVCGDCGSPIPEGRLDARPEAARCVVCQSKRDRLRRVKSSEIMHATASKPARVSRRTRCATGLAVRLLPPADRARYRQEFAAELADLPRCDQAPYAIRQARRAWSLRRSLTGSRDVRSTRVVVVVAAGAVSATSLETLGWPTAVLGTVLITALMWTVNSQDRTRHLASLIRAVRSDPTRKR